VLGLLLLFAGIAVGSMIFDHSDAWYKTWLRMGIALSALTPLYILHVLKPPPIEITAWKEKVEFEFTNLQFAKKFAAINGGEHSPS
jgi:hypothetical protein